jgi:PAS domain S-box-containing protein
MNPDPLVLHLQSDLLGNIIAYAADIKKCSENITTQIREIIAARVVGLFMREPDDKYRLLAACPERKSPLLGEERLQPLLSLAATFSQATFLKPGKGEAGLMLADLGMRESFVLPLRVEGESFGMLILLDLLDTQGIDKIFEALQDISGLLSLVFKNSFLYSNMESLVEQQTRALRASELRSQTILQSALDGFWCLDPQGKILEVNDSYCRMSGYSRRELLGMTVAQLEAQQSPEEIADRTCQVLSGQSAYFETTHRRKDGTVFSLEIYSQMLAGSDGKEMFAFLRDISMRKRWRPSAPWPAASPMTLTISSAPFSAMRNWPWMTVRRVQFFRGKYNRFKKPATGRKTW